MSELRLLALDPGSIKTGWATFAVARPRPGVRATLDLLETGVLEVGAKCTAPQRMYEMMMQAGVLFKRQEPNHVAMESGYVQVGPKRANPRSQLVLAEARGVLLAMAYRETDRVFTYAPSLIKKVVTGKGNAGKEHVRLAVESAVGFAGKSMDASDAAAVGLTHFRLWSWNREL